MNLLCTCPPNIDAWLWLLFALIIGVLASHFLTEFAIVWVFCLGAWLLLSVLAPNRLIFAIFPELVNWVKAGNLADWGQWFLDFSVISSLGCLIGLPLKKDKSQYKWVEADEH